MSQSDHHLIVVVEESACRLGFYDSRTGDRVSYIEIGFLPHEIDISTDQRTAYVSNFGLQDYDETIGVPGYSISIIDLPSMCETGRLYTFNQSGTNYKAPHAVKLRPGYDELFINVEIGGRILVFDLASETVKRELEFGKNFPDPPGTHNFVFSQDGSALYLFTGPQGVYKMDPDTGALIEHYASTSPIHGLAFMPNQQSLIASGVNEIVLLNPADLTVQKTFGNLGVQQIIYSAPTLDGKRIVCPATWDSQILVLDAETGSILKRMVTGIDPVYAHMAPDGKSAYITNARSRYISRIDLSTYELSAIETGEGPNGIATCPAYVKKHRKPLLFGAVLPLSGALSASGREFACGYQYWAECVNGAGGLAVGNEVYEVGLTMLDNQSDATQTASLTLELINDAKVQFLFGGYPTPSDQAAGPVVNKAGIPMITSGSAGDVIYNDQNHYLFGILSPASGYLKETIDIAVKLTPAPKTFSLLSSDDPAALEDALANAAYAKTQGLKILTPAPPLAPGIASINDGVIIYHEGETSFTPILQAIATLGPDLFLTTGHEPASEAIVNQGAAINFKAGLLSFAVGPSIPLFVQNVGPLAANLFGPAQWIPQLPALGFDRFGTASNFAVDYYQRYNLQASYLSAGAVASGLTFEDAIQRAGSIDRRKVRDALAATRLYTFYGLIEFNSKGINANKPLVTFQLQKTSNGLTNIILSPLNLVAAGAAAVWPFPGWAQQKTTTASA